MSSLDKDRRKKNYEKNRRIGLVITSIQFILTISILGILLYIDILPTTYLLIFFVVLLFFAFYTFSTQYTLSYRTFGKGVSILISIVLILGNYYLIRTNFMLSNITQAETKIDQVSILVLAEDKATSIDDATNYTFGHHIKLDRENTNKTIENVNTQLDTQINTLSYEDFGELVNALFSGEVKAIIFNEAYRDTLKEIVIDFDEKTKVLADHHIETEVEIEDSNTNVVHEPFSVYISGIDNYGSISKTGRSDVNIIATINPNTKEVLLITTPRDYYVTLPKFKAKDKLTHAGMYGVDISLKTLENLYGIKIDYYVRVNFTALINIVDALDGIVVNSDYNFKSVADPGKYSSYQFKKGKNKLNGIQALAFSRERKAFAAGDHQRGKNQMEVIKGIAKKAMSPAILINYGEVMDSISGSFETNMKTSEITDLVKMQLKDMKKWNIYTKSVTGTDDHRQTYSYQSKELYVMIPSKDSLEEAKKSINNVIAGIPLEGDVETKVDD